MKLDLKSLSLLTLYLLSTLFLTSCTVTSPINTTKQFLSLWQKEDYDKAFKLVIKATPQGNNKFKVESLSREEQTSMIEKTKKDKGKLLKFNVQNAIPLKDDILQKLGVSEGYEVFFYTETEKEGAKNNQYYLLKVDGEWHILPSIK